MPIKPSVLASTLRTKFGFVIAPTHATDHAWYTLNLDGLPPIMTKIGHHNEDIGPVLEARIAKQLRVRKPFYVEMMVCTKSRDEYYQQVRDAPYPGFDVRVL